MHSSTAIYLNSDSTGDVFPRTMIEILTSLLYQVQKQWEPLIPGHCAQAVPFYLTFSSLTIIFDVTT